jgi:hypothetical protein
MTRYWQLTLAIVALVAILTACTGAAAAPSVASLDDPAATGAPGASATASPATDPQEAFLAYARCMRENGVDMPDPIVSTDGGGGVSVQVNGGKGSSPTESKEEFAEANDACKHLMADVGPNGPAASMSPEDLDKLVEFAQCMREHGIDMPDPQTDGGFVTNLDDSGDGGKGPLDDSEFEAANEACAHLLPGKVDGGPSIQRGGDGPGGGTTTVPDPAESN